MGTHSPPRTAPMSHPIATLDSYGIFVAFFVLTIRLTVGGLRVSQLRCECSPVVGAVWDMPRMEHVGSAWIGRVGCPRLASLAPDVGSTRFGRPILERCASA